MEALPYGVIFKDEFDESLQEIHYIKDEDVFCKNYPNLPYWIETIKPYLRPMSSMTDEEKGEMYHDCYVVSIDFEHRTTAMIAVPNAIKVVNWLLEHHFDFLGLISKGLAIEVTESNNPYK